MRRGKWYGLAIAGISISAFLVASISTTAINSNSYIGENKNKKVATEKGCQRMNMKVDRNVSIVTDENFLRQKSDAVTQFDSELHNLLDIMKEIMISNNGCGLAAIQIGLPVKVIVIQFPGEEDVIELINANIVWHSSEKQISFEGCLSLPNYYAKIERSKSVIVEACDRNGKPVRLELDGDRARIAQHEIAHTEGKIMKDETVIKAYKSFGEYLEERWWGIVEAGDVARIDAIIRNFGPKGDKSFDINIKNADGLNALEYLISKNGSPEAIKILREAGL